MERLAVWCVVATLLAGCEFAGAIPVVMDGISKTQEEKNLDSKKKVDSFLADKPKELHSAFAKIVTEGERNHVLNRVRAGLAAMQSGHNDLASRTFDDALLTIETIYGGDEKAQQARGLFSAEDRKVFRGEPYERAMAYYYRGILYLMEGDYENARASFTSGFLQDTLAEKEEFSGDFALLAFMEGWASQCNGNPNLAEESYASAKTYKSGLVMPNSKDNTLVLADIGYAPFKYADGDHGELLKIKASSYIYNEFPPTWLDHELPNSESIVRQATTRGGREFDAILADKVLFKETTEAVADVSAAVSATTSAMNVIATLGGDDIPGLGLLGVGAGLLSLGSEALSQATQTIADTRQWDNLPEKVVYGTYHVDETAPRPKVKFNLGLLGISTQESNQPRGILVTKVLKDGPADQAEIRAGDVIVSIDGEQVDTYVDFSNRLIVLEPGVAVQIGLWRDGIDEGMRIVQTETKPTVTRYSGDHKCTVVWADGYGVYLRFTTANEHKQD